MTDMVFPQELFDCILENVVDRHTLANCALVNRTWARRSQKLLFREVSLPTIPPPKRNYRALLQLLMNSPHLGLLVKELSIYHLSVKRVDPTFDHDIGFIISSLINLTHIHLQFKVPRCEHRMDLPDFLSATVRPALQQLPHLHSVTFSDGDGSLARNVADMFRACDGLAVGKIVVRDCDGILYVTPSAANNLLSFPNVTEIEFLGRGFHTSLTHPWLSDPLTMFPLLHTITFGFSHSWDVPMFHINVLPPTGLSGVRCVKAIWHEFIPDDLRTPSEPNSETEETRQVLAIGTFPEVTLEYRIDVYNDIAVLWWCRVFGQLETSVIEILKLVVYTTGEDLTNLEPWVKLDGILSSWRFRLLKELTVQFWVTPFQESVERWNEGRIELSRLEFPDVSRKAKVQILIGSSPAPEFWSDWLS